jgi:hypothetical protein
MYLLPPGPAVSRRGAPPGRAGLEPDVIALAILPQPNARPLALARDEDHAGGHLYLNDSKWIESTPSKSRDFRAPQSAAGPLAASHLS